MSAQRQFKGWTIPGAIPPLVLAYLEDPSSLPPDLAVREGETLDVISGHHRIYQLKDGHRFSTDDVLVAWYGALSAGQVHRALDLGSGIGSVASIIAWKFPAAKMVTIEAQSESVMLARKTHRINGLNGGVSADRVDVRESDFRAPGILRDEERFDLITGSPPYFPLDAGVLSDHPQKIACRFEVRGDLSHYAEVAARHLAPGGVFAFVFPIEPAHQAARVKAALEASKLCLIRSRPIALKANETPLLGVFAATRVDDLPEAARLKAFQEPPLVIRTSDGKISEEYQAVKLSIGFPP